MRLRQLQPRFIVKILESILVCLTCTTASPVDTIIEAAREALFITNKD
jgi:hypothetical protein